MARHHATRDGAPLDNLVVVGMLFGFDFLSHQIGAFLGGWLGGVVYEAAGAYDLMWWLSIALALAATAVHLPISERRAPEWAPSTA